MNDPRTQKQKYTPSPNGNPHGKGRPSQNKSLSTQIDDSGSKVYEYEYEDQDWCYLAKLSPHHKEILRLKLIGNKTTEIAAILNITPQTIRRVLNSEPGKRKLEVLQGKRDTKFVNVQKNLTSLTQVAVEMYEEVLTKKVDAKVETRLLAAKDLLAMAGHGPIRKADVQINRHLNDDVNTRIRAKMQQLQSQKAQDAQDAMDAAEEIEYTEITPPTPQKEDGKDGVSG